MDDKIALYNRVLSSEAGVNLLTPVVLNDKGVCGKIELTVSGETLPFDVEFPLGYPLGFTRSSIRFVCKEIEGYLHQNLDHSICLHPEPDDDPERKLKAEINLLKRWMQEYYIEEKQDPDYGYLLVNTGVQACMLFESTSGLPAKGDHGLFRYMEYGKRPLGDKNYYEQFTALSLGSKIQNWSASLQAIKSGLQGVWIFIEDEPVIERRLVADNWLDLERYFSKEAMQFLYDKREELQKSNKKANPNIDYLFLMLGYKIPYSSGFEPHWELIKIPYSRFPTKGAKVNGKWSAGGFKDEKILWGRTSNCSYERFFGRGKLHQEITEKNILVIGVGAIGSSLVKHLVRGGVKRISVVDFDDVESGNICRSEYNLHHIGEFKAVALFKEMISISPFVDITYADSISKTLPGTPKFTETKTLLRVFDLIIDCSTDMEVAYMLDRMELKATVINLSITDKAKDMVCVVGRGNVSDQKAKIFSEIAPDAQPPTFYPGAGCPYPTFEASYTDINSLLSFALKQINFKMSKGRLNTFAVRTTESDGAINMVLHEY